MMDRQQQDERLAEMRKEHAEQQACLPLGYVSLLPALTRAAKSNGYALAVHGSMRRDLDLVAVPWPGTQDPAQKPHGRLAWAIHLGGGPYIDLSVMPRCRGCGASEVE